MRKNKSAYTSKDISDHTDLFINGCTKHITTQHARSKQTAFFGEDKKQETQKFFYVSLTVHHSRDLFYNNMYVTLQSST